MRLHNSLSGVVEDFAPLRSPATLYVCGVTPYDTTHLGHAATYVFFDLLVRLIERDGTPVRYVQNVTDVDDPLFERARQTGERWDHLARRQVDQFIGDMAALNVRPPDIRPFVSTEVPGMVDMIRSLEARGFTYPIGERIYFRTAKLAAYGTLAQVTEEYRQFRSREVGNPPDLPGKESPHDFLLWQPSAADEPAFASPWGPGRPGWHIECSAMCRRYLGDQIDIHGGGYDLAFPHHASEIAQSEAASGLAPFSRFWLHIGLVRLNGEKMSKSKGNLVFARDLLQRFDGDALRLYLYHYRYRIGWDYDESLLIECDRLATDLAEIVTSTAPASVAAESLGAEIDAALADDMDTPRAMAAFRSLVALGGAAGLVAARLSGPLGLRLNRAL